MAKVYLGQVVGPKGDRGEKGDPGIQGIQGDTGAKGDKGDQGIQGVPGAKGDKGDQGIQGIQGIQGQRGLKGVKGDTGAKGSQGIAGPNLISSTTDVSGFSSGDVLFNNNGKVGSKSVSGKKYSTVVVGNTEAGHTLDMVDFLCDGIDDDVEINQAIQSLSMSGGEVLLLEGVYNITRSIVVDIDYITLRGVSKDSTGFTCHSFADSTSSGAGLIYTTGDRITIADLFIWCAISNTKLHCVYAPNVPGYMVDVVIRDCNMSNNSDNTSTGFGISLGSSVQCGIMNCTIIYCNIGIKAGGSETTINNCKISSTEKGMVLGSRTKVTNCDIDANQESISSNGDYVSVTNSTLQAIVKLANSYWVNISQCAFQNHGISIVNCKNLVISNNTIEQVTGVNIALELTHHSNIIGNVIGHPNQLSTNGISLTNCQQNNISDNNFVNINNCIQLVTSERCAISNNVANKVKVSFLDINNSIPMRAEELGGHTITNNSAKADTVVNTTGIILFGSGLNTITGNNLNSFGIGISVKQYGLDQRTPSSKNNISNNTIPTVNVAGRFSILISNVNTYKPLNNLVSNNMIFGKDVSAESGSPDPSNTIINNKWN